MKDFFDCYQILTSRKIDKFVLSDAVTATFNNRQLKYNPDLQLFTNAFAADSVRLKRWQSFMKKINMNADIRFADVMKVINEQLKSIVDDYWKSRVQENPG